MWTAGCVVHRVGIIDVDPEPTLISMEGGRERLVLIGEGPQRLTGLEAHLVEVDGRRTGHSIAVSTFRVYEGPHGLAVWYGPVQVLGSQVGVADQGSGALVLVDDVTADELRRSAGAWVAVEGYVDGPQEITVLHWSLIDH